MIISGCLKFTPEQKIQKTCIDLDGKKGDCIPMAECTHLMMLFQKRPVSKETRLLLRNLQCGFEQEIPLLCCTNFD